MTKLIDPIDHMGFRGAREKAYDDHKSMFAGFRKIEPGSAADRCPSCGRWYSTQHAQGRCFPELDEHLA